MNLGALSGCLNLGAHSSCLPDDPGAVPDRFLRPDFPKGFVGVRQHLLHLLMGVVVKGAEHFAIEWIHGLIWHAKIPKVLKSIEHSRGSFVGSAGIKQIEGCSGSYSLEASETQFRAA
jgi:hypothetical protein